MLPKNHKFEPFDHENGGREISFGPYRVVPTENLLLRNGEKIPLKPKTLELLVFLLERNNRVVSKTEIINGVWSDSFVEEANLAVHISALRKIFGDNGGVVSIDTIPKVGYRLNIDGDVRSESTPSHDHARVHPVSTNEQRKTFGEHATDSRITAPRIDWKLFFAGVAVGIMTLGVIFYFSNGETGLAQSAPKKHHSFKTVQCPRAAESSNLVAGGCEEAVQFFSGTANPSGNWSYGYTPKDNLASFAMFERAQTNNHFASPEVPVTTWTRWEDWHPEILRNNSPLTIVIQDAVVVPPHMLQLHPGPNGERSVLRWTAPTDGHFRVQGQFRGLNTNGDTTTDVSVVFKGIEIFFADNVAEYNLEHPFEINFNAMRGDTVDVSVGYGSNKSYECDSTGVSVTITTISLSKRSEL